MSFGKRTQLPSPRLGEGPQLMPGMVLSYDRIEALHLSIIGLLKQTGMIAAAIREQGTVTVPPVAEEPDPEAGPVGVKGFLEHFAFLENDKITHAMLALADGRDEARLDFAPQLRLADLMGRVMDLNIFCQQAELDGALGVALQSPHIPDIVDGVLADAAWLASFTDRIIAALPADERPAERTEDAAPGAPGQNLERYYLMASDIMLKPDRIARLGPPPGADADKLARLVPIAPHAGDYFINGVYLHAGAAEEMLARLQAEEAADAPEAGRMLAIA